MPSRTASHTPIAIAYTAVSIILTLVIVVLAVMRHDVIGWPGLVWVAGFVLMGVIRAPHARARRENVITSNRRGWVETGLLAGVFITMMILPCLYLATGAFSFADYALPVWAAGLGAAAQLAFLWLFWRSHADLGRNWSPTLDVRDSHELVTRGVYRRMRHPMYAAIWLGVITQPLLVHNWIAGLAVLPAFALLYVVRVPREEAMMRETFGTAWDEYAVRTGRIFPRLRAAPPPTASPAP